MLGDIFEEPTHPDTSATETLSNGKDCGAGAESLLADALRAVLPQAEFDPSRSFFEHGGDSLAFVSFVLNLAVHIAEERLESVRPDRPLSEVIGLFQGPPADRSMPPRGTDLAARDRSGPVAMTSNRHAFLFRMPSKLDSWLIVSDLYEIDLPFVAGRFHAAIEAALAAFDGLRLRIRRDAGAFRQEIVPLDSVAAAELVTILDAADGDGDEDLRRCARQAAAHVNVGDSPFHVIVLRSAGRPGFGFVAICHHALIDAISNRVLRGFIVDAYRALSRSAEPAVPDAITYSRYCELYYEDCERRRGRGLEYWRRQPWREVAADPLGPAPGPSAAGTSEEVAEFIAVPDFPAFCSTLRQSTGHTLETLAVAAMARAYGLATGRRQLCLGLVAHGRGSLPGGADARRTLGWITEVVPVVLPTGEAASCDLDDIQDRMREADRHGRLYGYLRYLDPSEEVRLEFERHPYPNMTLNILLAEGEQGPARPRRSFGWDHSWHGERPFPMSGGLVGSADGVRLSWDFDIGLVAGADVAQFLDHCAAALRETLRDAVRAVPEGDGLRAWLAAFDPVR